MKSSKDYRRAAREYLAGNYGVVIGAYLIYIVLLNVISAPLSLLSGIGGLLGASVAGTIISVPVSVVISLISVVLNTGVNKISYDVVRGEKADLTNLFYCLTHNPLTVVFLYLWILLYMLPGVLVLLLGAGVFWGIILFSADNAFLFAGCSIFILTALFYLIWEVIIGLKVSMAGFLYYENSDMRARDIIKGSMEMMKGNCFRLFRLVLSYIGYYLLGLLSCGLAMLWVSPNITAAMALFFLDLKNRGSGLSSNPEKKAEAPGQENIYYGQNYWN